MSNSRQTTLGSFAVAILAAIGLSACSVSKVCTEIGCQDQFAATISGVNNAFPSGSHEIVVKANDTTLSCAFAFPLESLPSGGTRVPTCSPGLMVDVAPATVCTEVMTDTARGLRCDPIPGQFVQHLTISGTPASVAVQQTVDGALILDETVTPNYVSNRPNGPGCDPLCRQARTTWTFAPL